MPHSRARCGVLAFLLVWTWAACGPPPFKMSVTWSEPVEIEAGAAVIYQGVRIGEVRQVALHQPDRGRAAVVAVTLAIDDPTVSIRLADRFHLGELEGEPVVEIRPWHEASAPLPPGSTVVGVPPLVTRVEEQIGEAIDTIGEAALEAIDSAIEALEDEEILERPDPAADTNPAPPL